MGWSTSIYSCPFLLHSLSRALSRKMCLQYISLVPNTMQTLSSVWKLKMINIAEFKDCIRFVVGKIKDVRSISDVFEFFVAWKWFAVARDSWEPWEDIFEDVPTNLWELFTCRRSSAPLRTRKRAYWPLKSLGGLYRSSKHRGRAAALKKSGLWQSAI